VSTTLVEVNRLSGQQIETCYHCHKCTAGCPVVGAMQYGPDRILRMIALDQFDLLLPSRDIWLCVGCYTCATRCPNGIDISAVMDSLRQLALQEHIPAGEGDAFLFHQLFMRVVQRMGRSHEAVMLGLFKILSHVPLMDDVGAGIGLFLRGKVPLLPDRTRAAGEVRRIFHDRRQP
jgi:heterodisulfide reductase subunit C